MSRKVVITGVGVIAPNGKDTDEFWTNCLKGISVAEPIPEQWKSYAEYTSTLWAPLPDIDYNEYPITRIEKMQQGETSLLVLAASHQALTDANFSCKLSDPKKSIYQIEEIDPFRCGVFIGTGAGGISSLIENQSYHTFSAMKNKFDELLVLADKDFNENIVYHEVISNIKNLMKMPFRFNPFAVSIIMPNACSSVPGIKYGLQGPNQTYTGACAAGTIAIGNAFRSIRDNIVDCALTGGVEFLGDPFGGLFRGFDQAKALVTNCENAREANRPFDVHRSGFLFSQGGAAVLILEEEGHAQNRGAEILAEVIAYSESFDAYNIMIMEPGGEAIDRMVRQSLKNASIEAEEIDYINAHGTGTQINDETEAMVIDRIFSRKPLVNSTKSLIGHTIGASGAIEAVVTALSIKNNKTHPCNNLKNPVRDLNFITKSSTCEINYALSQSFAFGGHNAVLVFKKYSS